MFWIGLSMIPSSFILLIEEAEEEEDVEEIEEGDEEAEDSSVVNGFFTTRTIFGVLGLKISHTTCMVGGFFANVLLDTSSPGGMGGGTSFSSSSLLLLAVFSGVVATLTLILGNAFPSMLVIE